MVSDELDLIYQGFSLKPTNHDSVLVNNCSDIDVRGCFIYNDNPKKIIKDAIYCTCELRNRRAAISAKVTPPIKTTRVKERRPTASLQNAKKKYH